LALRLPEIAFEAGREEELKRRIVVILDERLATDKIPLGQQLRNKLIESIMADIVVAQKERFGLRLNKEKPYLRHTRMTELESETLAEVSTCPGHLHDCTVARSATAT